MKEQDRILVVDDDESVRKTFSAILEENGYVVDTAENGKKAIEKTHKNFYNAALIDIRLPDMEGTELLTAMKETTPRMRKIIITGYPALQNAVEAVNKGADAYVLKPPKMKELLSTLKEHLQKQKEEKQLSEEKVAEFIQRRSKEIGQEKRK
ncbi:MAG: response regulator [Candidatus Bathyarchaeota archaeon]|nr:response regulator [Candidatus Bathyarchaeota archaeon]